MAGGSLGPVGVSHERAQQYQGRVTAYVVLACMVAAIGGALFGYDIGISDNGSLQNSMVAATKSWAEYKNVTIHPPLQSSEKCRGVTSMNSFLKKFFPEVYHRKKYESDDSDYCKYDNQGLAAFTSSLYIAGLIASLFASIVTRRYGRKISIICGGLCFIVGAALNASAANLIMLILGRVMLGVGIGFGNQAVPLYLSELAPAKVRGGLNMMFQLATTLGILTANLINYGTEKINSYGWRISLGLAALPGFLMMVGGIFLPETPNSLIERGRMEEGRAVLEKTRGTKYVDAEFADLVDASELAKAIKHPFRNTLQRRNLPQLVMAICMPAFQILTGINSILFYVPVLFQSLGFGGDASLYSSIMTGAVLVGATLVSIFIVDRWGRRVLLLGGGIQMIICMITCLEAKICNLECSLLGEIYQISVCPSLASSYAWMQKSLLIKFKCESKINAINNAVSMIAPKQPGDVSMAELRSRETSCRHLGAEVAVGIILAFKFGGDKELSKGFSVLLVIFICLFVAAFGWSWGPLGWTVPSEIFPLETRSAGQGITVSVNLFFTFAIAQSFLTLLCKLKYGIFLFFAGWIFIMTTFVYFFLPETKGVPIEEMAIVWQKHWFWKNIVAHIDELDTEGKFRDPESNINGSHKGLLN
eukprot:Gb_40051 [translate_table: standard]